MFGAGNQWHRNWTVVGNLDSVQQGVVDPRGLVTPWAGGWSLDWWIGADDRWHIPAREVGVRQRLVEATPVVETAMRIPGGDAVQRVYAMRRSSLDGGGELLMVEVENSSKLPVALALAVRPYNHQGVSRVGSIDLFDGTTVTVDDRPALLLPKAPARFAASTLTKGDSAQTVVSGAAADHWPGAVECPDGLAQAAFVYPLAHGSRVQVALPIAAAPGPRRWLRRSRVNPEPTSFPTAVPAPAQVAKGWVAQTQRGLRVDLPDARLVEAVEANRRFLLLMHDKPDVRAQHQLPGGLPDETLVLTALDLHGFHDEATAALLSYATQQRADGAFVSRHSLSDGDIDGSVLSALVRHWRLTRDRELVEAVVDSIVAAAHRIGRSSRRGSGRDRQASNVAGLRAAAELLEVAGQPDVAHEVARLASVLQNQLLTESPGQQPPDGGIDEPVARQDPDDRATSRDEGQSARVPSLASLYATVELTTGDPRCLDRLARLLETATPTWTWPEMVDPEHGGGVAGAGHDVSTTAGLLSFVRNLLVREDDDGLVLASVVPEAWHGQGWEVHDAPTEHGRLSYAVRWHGERPALLWELDRSEHDDAAPVRLSAPGLDPHWSSSDLRGETLLR
jgi:hypothetical protein